MAAAPHDGFVGLTHRQYQLSRGNTSGIHLLAAETESKVVRAEACASAAIKLREEGFYPDIICGHPGWGETLFLADVWPESPILHYQEFFYHPSGLDTTFDSELQGEQLSIDALAKVRMKNAYLHLALDSSRWNVTPTNFQRSTFPEIYQSRMSVIHDGIDVNQASRLGSVSSIRLSDQCTLSPGDSVVTFVNRRLEPYRGCHTFIRAIPEIQRGCPNAKIVVVGATSGVSYGAACPSGEWRDVFLNEIHGQYNPSNIFFVGSVSYQHFLSLLRLSACHVYLTYPFVLSWSLLEAMSCSCPVVGSATSPVQEVIQHGRNGLLVDFFSPNDLSVAVCEILHNSELSSSLGSSARQTIIDNYSLSRCLPRHLQLIDLVAAGALGA